MTVILIESKQERVQSCRIAERQTVTSSVKQDGWLSCKEAGTKSGMTDSHSAGRNACKKVATLNF